VCVCVCVCVCDAVTTVSASNKSPRVAPRAQIKHVFVISAPSVPARSRGPLNLQCGFLPCADARAADDVSCPPHPRRGFVKRLLVR